MREAAPPAVLMVLESMYPTRGGGGAETQVRTLARELHRQGVGVSVLAPRVPWGPQLGFDRVDGIPVRRIAYPRLPGLGALSLLLRLAALLWLRRHDYAVIHAHIAGNMAAVCCLMGRLLGKPVIVKLTGLTEMAGGILDPRPGWTVRLRQRALRRASHYQATSARIGRLLAERGFDAGRVRLIPNAVDAARFAAPGRDAALRRELCGEAARVGIFVGRLAPEKGLELLVEGWARVFARRDDAVLIVVGDGELREKLPARCAALGIGAQLRFVGASDAVARYLGIADFALLPSLQEGLSNTLLEAMAAGLPVLGSRVSGTEDFVRPGETGWLFEPQDLDGFEAALRSVAALAPAALQRMGQDARRLVLARASIGAVLSQLAELYGVSTVKFPAQPAPASSGARPCAE